jgi:hypothetical protein
MPPASAPVPVSVAGAAPVRVPAEQVKALCDRTTHLGRLSERMHGAAETGETLAVTESEAVLLVAELRRGAGSDVLPLTDLRDALLGRVRERKRHS